MKKNIQIALYSFLLVSCLVFTTAGYAQTIKKVKKRNARHSIKPMMFTPPKIVKDDYMSADDMPPTCFIYKANKSRDSIYILSGIAEYHLEYSSTNKYNHDATLYITTEENHKKIEENHEKISEEAKQIATVKDIQLLDGTWKIENNLFIFKDKKNKKTEIFTIIRDEKNKIIKLISKDKKIELEKSDDCGNNIGIISIAPTIGTDNNNNYSNNQIATINDIVITDLTKRVSDKGKIKKDALIILKRDGEIISIDLDTKKKNWKYNFSDGSSSKMRNRFRIQGSTIYITSTQRQLAALNINNGNTYWKSTIGLAETENAYMINGQHVPIKDSLIYLSSCNKEIYAFNKFTGAKVWNYELNFEFNIYSPIISENSLFINNAPWVYHFDATTGQKIWQKTIGKHYPLYTLMQADDKRIYVGSENGLMYALNIKNNANVDWQFKIENDQSDIQENTLLANKILYVGTNKGNDKAPSIYAIQTDNGTALWKRTLDNGKKIKEMYLINNHLIGFTNAISESLFVIDINNGEKIKIENPKENPISNIFKYSEDEFAFITAHYLTIYNVKTNTYQYQSLALNDIEDKDFNMYAEIVRKN